MTETRNGLVAVLTLSGLATLVHPVAAQSGASTTDGLIWGLNYELLAVAIPITLLVEGILVYTVWRYRADKVDEPKPTRENRRLEITWTVATAVVLLFVGIASYGVLADEHVTSSGVAAGEDDTLEVDVVAQKYSWTFEYPEHNVTTGGTMVLSVDREVRLNVTSKDWLHSFHVPGLGLKQDAFPGQANYLTTEPTETGAHQLYCAEYCGAGHSGMLGTVEVVSQEDFQDWLDEQSA
ncbi:cytochrome c oxidase subunit II [Halorhabdus rudnickae]|uniref:cytochrome c oxidase subunit II n=1 Tax=Halorhabdus rudnickae TaxID=1775544 RepID=UPI001082AB2E|nr:cytochrome c oxidase subunit II [Halorhabdus rudnickae]